MQNPTNKIVQQILKSVMFSVTLAVSLTLARTSANAQCTELVSGLLEPIGTVLTDQGNLLVAESGDNSPGSGRVSIVDSSGNRRTLLDGLPSAPADVGDPSGPTGMTIHGRNLYLAIGVGDVGIAGPLPGSTLENPNGPSSPIFSSVLRLQFSASTENTTTGFTLTPADEQALADGQEVVLSHGGGDRLRIKSVVDFPNFIPFPLPDVPDNIQVSNPFSLAGIDDSLYVTDGGRNLVWQTDIKTGFFSELVNFPNIPNPLFPTLGGPFLQAVPTGIEVAGGKLLVTLLRGAPFPTGTSTVEEIDPSTGSDTVLIDNLTSTIDIIPRMNQGRVRYFVLEFSSEGPFFSGPGTVLRFDDPAGPPVVIADCLTTPTSMTHDRRTGTLYISEVIGTIVTIPLR